MSWIEVRATVPPLEDLSPFVEVFREHGVENTLEEPGPILSGCLVEVEGTPARVEELTKDAKDAQAKFEARVAELQKDAKDLPAKVQKQLEDAVKELADTYADLAARGEKFVAAIRKDGVKAVTAKPSKKASVKKAAAKKAPAKKAAAKKAPAKKATTAKKAPAKKVAKSA